MARAKFILASFAGMIVIETTMAANAVDRAGKWDCLTEKSSEVGPTNDGKEYIAAVDNLAERDKHFVLSIRPSFPDKYFCRQTLDHWLPMMERDGNYAQNELTAPGSNEDPQTKKHFDWRSNIGPHCFSTMTATIKFFTSDVPTTLFSYDFEPYAYHGQVVGDWLEFRDGKHFDAGLKKGMGGMVFAGTCEREE